jgi:nucleotide-binding universal stress UspA family protein
MKILVAYDGSTYANDALDDLQRAGLPDNVEAVVLSVADLWVLPQDEDTSPSKLGPSSAIQQARRAAANMRESAEVRAQSGAARLSQMFPNWQVRAETAANSPAWAIILKAEEWGADLLVVGSRGYSQLGRWVLGSVSQTVLTHARCAVRIARSSSTQPGRPLRILVGVDGSSESELAIRTVSERDWPQGTDIRLVMVLNSSLLREMPAPHSQSGDEQSAADAEVEAIDGMIGRMLNGYAATVSKNSTGATVSTSLLPGDPKRVLVEEAEQWGADCIFIGSRGLNRLERLLLGSVSSAIAVRAHCTVEVVREPHTPAQ